jgi:hypothetical protein
MATITGTSGNDIIDNGVGEILAIPANSGFGDFDGAISYSPDGTKIAFENNVTNFYFGGGSYYSISVDLKDFSSGAVTLISSDGRTPIFSPDGTSVAFTSQASNLPGANGAVQIYLKNLTTGVVTLESPGGSPYTDPYSMLNGFSSGKIFFASSSTSLIPNAVDHVWHEYVKDLNTGVITLLPGTTNVGFATVSRDGSTVAFSAADPSSQTRSYVLNVATGAVTQISADHPPASIAISADGAEVAFGTGDNIFVENLLTGAIVQASVTPSGQSGAVSFIKPAFSPDGTKVAFVSDAALLPGDTNGTAHVYIKDLITGAVTLASTLANGQQSPPFFESLVFSPDGSHIAFLGAQPLSSNTGASNFTVYVDNLTGGGDNTLTGDLGADTFVFTPNQSGHSVVTDFSHAQGDRIDLSAFAAINSFAHLAAHMTQVGSDTQIALGGLTITLTGATVGALSNADFVLAPNQAPTVAASNHIVAASSSTAASSWFTYADANSDSVVTYRFWDGGQNGGYISTANTAHAPIGQNIDVAAEDLGSVVVHGGASGGSQTLWVQAFDGTDWGPWASFTLTTQPNHPPIATIANQTLAAHGVASVANLVNYSDVESSPATQYRFWDGGADATSGYFSDSASAHEASSANITVAAADLGSVQIHGGSSIGGGSETLWVQAYDGSDWGPWASFTLTTLPNTNHLPAASIANQTLAATAVVSVAGLLNYSDADSNAATQYHLWDSGTATNSGFFSDSNSAHEAVNANITVDAANLGSVQIHGGTAGGAETMMVQAFDGIDWGAWSSFTLTTLPNHAPAATVANQTMARSGVVSVAGLLTYTDADSNAATQYHFWDSSADSSSAYFSDSANAYEAANANITVAAANLASVQIHAGSNGAVETMWVQAFDGIDWGAWSSFTVTNPANHLPVTSIANQTLAANSVAAVAGLLSYSDADSDVATQYRFWDDGTAATSGYFSDSANAQEASGANITVAAANLSSVQIHGGSVGGTETLWVQAYDGTSWGAWSSFTLTTTPPPPPAVATIANQTLAANGTVSVAGLINYSDPGGHAATQYNFWDGGLDATSGYFSDSASAHEASGANITVAAANLSSVQIHGGSVGGTETLWVQAFDGIGWGAWSSFTLTTNPPPVNHPPVATIANQTVAANGTVSVAGLLTYSDADSDVATQYRFWDDGTGSTSGYFSDSAHAQDPSGANITVAAADIGSVQIHGGSVGGTETLWVQAYDGTSWGGWSSFTLTTTPPPPPAVATIANQTLAANGTVSVAGLINYSDPGGHAATQYQFWDGGLASTSGYFSDSAHAQDPSGANITVAAADLGSVQIHGGSVGGSETLWVQAFDGTSWGAWSSFTLTTLPNHPPVATIDNQTLAANGTVSVAGLIHYSDADGDAATQYRFWDSGLDASSGYFSDSASSHEPVQANITVAAANLSSVQIHGGSVGGTETLWVQAFDGTDWGAWSSFTLTTTPPAANHLLV